MEIVPKFLELDLAVTEEEFLQGLTSARDLSPEFPGEVDIVVATLFIIRGAIWFWPFLG